MAASVPNSLPWAALTTRRRPLALASTLPAVLAFALLFAQALLPWMVKYYASQDGPSHVYGAVVLRSLLFDPHSIYKPFYQIQSGLVPNWSMTLAFAAAVALVGVDHAEQLIASLFVVFGFFAFSYACRSFAPRWSPWSPLALLILQSTFARQGFYSFEYGMMLGVLLIGFAARHARRLTPKRGAALAAGLVLLYSTHIIPTCITLLTIGLMGVWMQACLRPPRIKRDIGRGLLMLALALLPCAVLVAMFGQGSAESMEFRPQLEYAWKAFPMGVFWFGTGPIGRMELLVPLVVGCIVMALGSLRRPEWRSPVAILALMTVVCFLLYLFLPDNGFGGSVVKIRFSWAMFVFGCLLVSCVKRMRAWRVPLSVYMTLLLASSLVVAKGQEEQTSRATAGYVEAVKPIPPGKTMLRIRYIHPRSRIGVPDDLPFDGLVHAGGFAAAQRGWVDLSDYEGLSHLYPVKLGPAIADEWHQVIWGLEVGGGDGASKLEAARKALPVPVDYVLLIGEPVSGGAEYAKTVAQLEQTMRQVPGDANSVYRLYRRAE